MVRRVLLVVFSVLVAAVPLANTFCFEGCGRSSAPSPAHHSCAQHDSGAEQVSSAPKACASNDVASSRIIELRRTTDGLATIVAVTFEPLVSSINPRPAPVRPLTRFHSSHTPLRI
jgi:hypothetical protein